MSKKWVDKKKAQTFAVVHRSHDDEKFYDEEVGDRILVPVENLNQVKKRNEKIKTKSELEQELKDEIKAGKIRANEGEAALYGITYDDSKYDYMQHLKPIGEADGVFIAKTDEEHNKGKGDIKFKEFDIEKMFENRKKKAKEYQAMQDIPDEIKGIKPDMDPRLREVLEALEDEEYVDNDEDILNNLLKSGEKKDGADDAEDFDEFDLDNFDDQGYDTETFEKEGDEGWEANFRKFKEMTKNKHNEWDSDDDFDDEDESENEEDAAELAEMNDVLGALPAKGKSKKARQRERRKKGSMTDTSSYSMSSSALFRTEGMKLLDDRFENLMIKEQEEEEDEPEDKGEFDFSKERTDLEDLLDDFLDNYELERGGRTIAKKNPEKLRLQRAADSVSRGKLAKKRNKEINRQ